MRAEHHSAGGAIMGRVLTPANAKWDQTAAQPASKQGQTQTKDPGKGSRVHLDSSAHLYLAFRARNQTRYPTHSAVIHLG